MSDASDHLVAICRAFGAFEREAVCCGTVTVPQCFALQALLAGPADLTRLAKQAGSSPSAMTRLVDGLETRGWVERARPREDRRRVQVELTATGREEAERLRAITEDLIEHVLEHIPAGKRAAVVEALGLVRAAVETTLV